MAPQQIGELLRQAREKKGLSLYALAKASGLERGNLWRIEQGNTGMPGTDVLAKLAGALDMSLTDLLTQVGYVNSSQLPELRPYLRAKYGYLPKAKQQEIADYFDRIEAEYGEPGSSPTKNDKQ